jgi:F420-0:gamma-glutamyl ligase
MYRTAQCRSKQDNDGFAVAEVVVVDCQGHHRSYLVSILPGPVALSRAEHPDQAVDLGK